MATPPAAQGPSSDRITALPRKSSPTKLKSLEPTVRTATQPNKGANYSVLNIRSGKKPHFRSEAPITTSKETAPPAQEGREGESDLNKLSGRQKPNPTERTPTPTELPPRAPANLRMSRDKFRKYGPAIREQTLTLMTQDPDLLRRSITCWLSA